MKNKRTALAGSDALPCSLASFTGFTATKDFRSARRAMSPTVGDTFITRRNGDLVFVQVDWVDHEWIGFGRFNADTGEALLFGKIAQNDWKQSAMKALRLGCEFRPANIQSAGTATSGSQRGNGGER
jgi:hypothetical protein